MDNERAARVLAPVVRRELAAAAAEVSSSCGQSGVSEVVGRACRTAAALSRDARQALAPPALSEGCVVLRGIDVDQDRVGPTPTSWQALEHGRTAELDAYLLVLASHLGEVFGWAGQQDGRFVHEIVPTRGHEREQTGASSTIVLDAHTEDAFHPARAHIVLLACVRNPDRVATTIANIRMTQLGDSELQPLMRPVLPILPDASYVEAEGGFAPIPVSTCWTADDGLCMRFDPAYTPWQDAPSTYRKAYEQLSGALGDVTANVVLDPGDVLVLDNDVVVHGRVPFDARYDGADRWLKRVSVSVPGRNRPTTDPKEHGYGQHVIRPRS